MSSDVEMDEEVNGELAEDEDVQPKQKSDKKRKEKNSEGKKKKKKPKRKLEEDEDEEEADENVNEKDEDFQKEFVRLGHADYSESKKIKVVSSWIKQATEFPAQLIGDNLRPLEEVSTIIAVHSHLKQWFPVQRAVLPILMDNVHNGSVVRLRDIAISAPTGSGKTLCYVLPILEDVMLVGPGKGIRSIIVVPVQGLVRQIEQELTRFKPEGVSVVGLSGAEQYEKERRRIMDLSGIVRADIVVATPTRLVEHIVDPIGTFDVSRLRFIVADEADRMKSVREEWLELIESRNHASDEATNIASFVSTKNCPQKILLSATLSGDVEKLQKWNLHRPRLFKATVESVNQLESGHVLPSTVKHRVMVVPLKYHPFVLFNLINNSEWKRVLVFTNSKLSSERLRVLLSMMGSLTVEELSANILGHRRQKILKRFTVGTTRVLICSDVLARGIDVAAIDCVVNYDVPNAMRSFVHRAGRTGRAGSEGTVITMCEKDPRRLFVMLLKKHGLWTNVEEITMTENEIEEDEGIEEYNKALVQYKNQMKTRKMTNRKMKNSNNKRR